MPKLIWTIQGEADHPDADAAEMERSKKHFLEFVPDAGRKAEVAANNHHHAASQGLTSTMFTQRATEVTATIES